MPSSNNEEAAKQNDMAPEVAERVRLAIDKMKEPRAPEPGVIEPVAEEPMIAIRIMLNAETAEALRSFMQAKNIGYTNLYHIYTELLEMTEQLGITGLPHMRFQENKEAAKQSMGIHSPFFTTEPAPVIVEKSRRNGPPEIQ